MDEQKLEELKLELIDTDIQVRWIDGRLEIQRMDIKQIHQSMAITDKDLLSGSAVEIANDIKEFFSQKI